MSRNTRNTDLTRATDRRLVERIEELMEAKQAVTAVLMEAASEWSRRRLVLVREGKAVEGPLETLIAPTPSFAEDQARREGVARQHFECDEAARRDPHMAALLRG